MRPPLLPSQLRAAALCGLDWFGKIVIDERVVSIVSGPHTSRAIDLN